MIKHYRNTFIFLNFCLLSLTAGAQAPDKMLDNITLRFKNYVTDYPWEEIYVHTDRQDYISGENVWFALYLVDRQSLKPSGISKIAYVEVFNSEKRQVAGKRIKIENGQGSGQVILPDTLSSGTYTLRAYTNWMKNFLPDNCFSMTINVYNAVSNSGFTGFSTRESSPSRRAIPSDQVPYQSSGYVVDIDNSNAESAIINIGTTRDLRNREGSLVYLFIETRGNINFSGSVNLTANKTSVPIPRYYFIPGINHITIFNGQGKPVSEYYMLTKSVSADTVEIISPPDIKTREHVSLNIAVKGGDSGKTDSSALSISIVPVTGGNFPGIGNYMIFGSEFGFPPERTQEPSRDTISGKSYENLPFSLRSRWIDWNRIYKDKKPVIRYRRESEEHFIYGRLLNQSSGLPDPGKYLFLSIPGKNAYFQYSLTDMNGDFFIRVPVDDYYRDLIIQPEKVDANDVIKSESSFSEKYPSQISDEDFLTGKPPENISKMKINYQVEKIYKTETTAANSKPPVYAATSRRFYGKPDVELKMDDYIKLPVMQEVFFELLPGATLKSRKSGYEMIITDPVEYKPFEVPPTLFIDGVVINDAAVIANLDPELVERIDAVRERYFVGDYMFYGLVNVITRAGNFSNVTLPDYAVRIPYRVIDPEVPFTSPDYSTAEMKKSRIPDFRNSLYWNPSVKTDGDGKAEVGFWTSDFVTDYEIIVQGLSHDGKPFYSRKIISIKK